MNRSPLRTVWTLAAVAGASVVGVFTRDPGLIIVTFVGTLVVPRMLGLAGHRHGLFCGHRGHRGWRQEEHRPGLEARLEEWHRRAHQDPAGTGPRGDAAASA